MRRDRHGSWPSAWSRESGTAHGNPAPVVVGATQASPTVPETTPELEAFISTHVDYPSGLIVFEPGGPCCSLSSSILAPDKPVPSASTVASPSTVRLARSRPDAARVCPSHLDARRAASRGEKSEIPASSRRCVTATCEVRDRSRPVRRIQTSPSTRRSAPAVCVPSASRSSQVSTGRFSAASASMPETAADGRQSHPEHKLRCHSEPAGEESHVP
jgi:hypothetical protein